MYVNVILYLVILIGAWRRSLIMNLVIVEAYLIFISKPCYCIKEIYWIGLKALEFKWNSSGNIYKIYESCH